MTKNEFVGLFEGAEKSHQDAMTRRARAHLERTLKFTVSRQALMLWRKNPNSTSKLSSHYLRAYMAAMKELAGASCVGSIGEAPLQTSRGKEDSESIASANRFLGEQPG